MVHKNCNFLNIDNLIIFGSYDEKMKIFEINNEELNKSENNIGNKKLFIQKGELIRQSKVKTLYFDKSDYNIFCVLNNDNSIEFFKILNKREIINRIIQSLISKDKNNKKEKLIKKEKFNELINIKNIIIMLNFIQFLNLKKMKIILKEIQKFFLYLL